MNRIAHIVAGNEHIFSTESDVLVSRLMRKPVTVIDPDTTVRSAAALMRALDMGALPICKDMHPVGIVTDRDIVTRWVSRKASDAPISEIMTHSVIACQADQSVECAAHIMADAQVRRLVVVDHSSRVVGMISLGDIANDADEILAGQTLGEIIEMR